MDKITAELLHHTPEFVIRRAMNKPYAKELTDKNWRKITYNTVHGKKHKSVMEHIVLNWDIDGYSRMILQQFSRHRIQSKTVESSRFALDSILSGDDVVQNCVIPYPMIKPEDMVEFIDDMGEMHDLMKSKIKKWKGKKYKNDTLKYFLMEAVRTSEVCTFNLSALCHLFDMRLEKTTKNNPHEEFMLVTNKMLEQVWDTEIAWLFEHYRHLKKEV